MEPAPFGAQDFALTNRVSGQGCVVNLDFRKTFDSLGDLLEDQGEVPPM